LLIKQSTTTPVDMNALLTDSTGRQVDMSS
jgi:hypothetical protein